MYRGLVASHQVADRLRRSGIMAPASNTSNGEYGGWFGHGPPTQPSLTRAKSDTVWRSGNGYSGNTSAVHDIMQLLKQTHSTKSLCANDIRSGTGSSNLPGTKSGPYVQVSSDAAGATDAASGLYTVPETFLQTSRKSFSEGWEEVNEQHGERLLPASFGRQFPSNSENSVLLTRFPGAETVQAIAVPSKTVSTAMPRGFSFQSPVSRQLQGPHQSDKLHLMKSSTTLGLSTELPEEQTSQNDRPFVSNVKATAQNGFNCGLPGNSAASNVRPIPAWRSRWSQNRLHHADFSNRQGHVIPRSLPNSSSEISYRPDPTSLSNSDSRLSQGTVTFSSDGGRSYSTFYMPTGGDDDSNAELTNRWQEDRTTFIPERVNTKLETVAPVGLQRQGTLCSSGEENRTRFGRYGSGTILDINNLPSRNKVLAEQLNLNGACPVQPPGVVFSQSEIQNRTKGYSNESLPCNREPGMGTGLNGVNSPLSTNYTASAKKSILKKPKVCNYDCESGMYAKRRLDLYTTAGHSANSIAFFGDASGNPPNGNLENYSKKRHDSNQKRVTFRLNE